MRNICSQLATPDFRVLYLCNTAASPFDIYRSLALELGLSPAHRKSQLWWALKAELVRLLDEAQHLGALRFERRPHLAFAQTCRVGVQRDARAFTDHAVGDAHAMLLSWHFA